MVIKFKDSEKKLLRILLNSEVTYTAEELSEKMNVSRRSIFYLMKSISKKLLSLNIAPIKNIHGEGYYLSDASKQLISQLTLHESGREDCHSKPNLEIRQAIFFLFLIVNMKVSTLSEISYVTNVSMNTVLNDQKSLLEKLQKFSLDSYGDRNGHHVVGNEKDIRSYIQSNWKALNEAFNVLFRYRKNSNFNELNNIEVYESIIAKWLDLIEANNYFYFSDDSKKRIKFIYALIVSRMMHHHHLKNTDLSLSEEEKNLLETHKEYSLAESLLQQFGFSGFKNEILYLESLILGLQLTNLGIGGKSSVKSLVKDATKKVIQNFERLSNRTISKRTQLLDELFIHLLSTFYRVKYHHQYDEDIATKVQKKYSAIYVYTKLSIRPFELLNDEKLNENEIALITIYFGAQLITDNNYEKSVLLVCSSGLGTSRLLKAQLEKEFPEIKIKGPITKSAYNNLKSITSEIVFSTIDLPNKGKEVFKVSPILSAREINVVRKVLVMHNFINSKLQTTKLAAIMDVVADNAQIQNYEKLENGIKEILTLPESHIKKTEREQQPLLSELVNRKTIKFADANQLSWQQAIRLAAQPLVKSGNVDTTYVDAMIENVKKNGPYINIGNLVAFAHARPEKGVNELGMSMLHLSKPIDLIDSKHQIQLVFVLAAIDDTSHIRAMSELATLLGNKEKLNKLIQAQNSEDIEKTILEGEMNND